MKNINLLPHDLQKAKDVRRVTIIITGVQIVAFSAVVLLYVIFSIWEARLDREVQVLARLTGESAMQQAGVGARHHFFHEDFLLKDALVNAQTVPDGVWLVVLRFSHGEFGITAATSDILNIQAHMELLDKYFNDIRLSNLTASDDGYYVYELYFFDR